MLASRREYRPVGARRRRRPPLRPLAGARLLGSAARSRGALPEAGAALDPSRAAISSARSS